MDHGRGAASNELIPYYRFIQKTVQEHTSREEGLSARETIWAFLRFMVTHGLSLSTVLAIAKQLTLEVEGQVRLEASGDSGQDSMGCVSALLRGGFDRISRRSS